MPFEPPRIGSLWWDPVARVAVQVLLRWEDDGRWRISTERGTFALRQFHEHHRHLLRPLRVYRCAQRPPEDVP